MMRGNGRRSAVGTGVYTAMFILILWAYAQTLYVSFGSNLEQWKDIYSAFIRTFPALNDGIDLDSLRDENFGLLPREL